MSSKKQFPPPPDASERDRALDTKTSVIVQAPAGSGKTTLLTERFIRLLGEVDDPRQIVAITFTNAAATEMRNRILDELRNPAPGDAALRAIERAQLRGWKILDVPSQLRIATIDSFSRELALQQPMLTQLSQELDVSENPADLYRMAARHTLQRIDDNDSPVGKAVKSLLQWRDNNWNEMEELLITMLRQRDRWMHGWVLERDPDWDALRRQLERPFQRASEQTLRELESCFLHNPRLGDEVLALARFACESPGSNSPHALANCLSLPKLERHRTLSDSLLVYDALAGFLLTKDGTLRSPKGLKTADGFPSTDAGRNAKARFATLVQQVAAVPRLHTLIAAVRDLPPAHYSDDEWGILQACFTLLRHAAAELRVLFAEQGVVDFIEVAQSAARGLEDQDGQPTDTTLANADEIHHLLVDEFQDTSRRQHELLSKIIRAWPDSDLRTCFIVGDPMQSIYFFRDADAELFARVKDLGFEMPDGDNLSLEFVSLAANFRSEPQLVTWNNDAFTRVFAASAQNDLPFTAAMAVRDENTTKKQCVELHLDFVPRNGKNIVLDDAQTQARASAATRQIDKIVSIVQQYGPDIEEARRNGTRFRVAILARTKKALAPIALALRQQTIPFRAIDLEDLQQRQEVLDALALARAWVNPFDRVAWLGVLRAPWCGLTLQDLHTLTSADNPAILEKAIPELIRERSKLISEEGRARLQRIERCHADRIEPQSAALGSWLQQVWTQIGGDACVDANARGNLEMLWRCLDGLPRGIQDLSGPALHSALETLKAQPDPNASSECGVQLMTIHKSKGLEFEAVLVPELHAAEGRGRFEMLSWLERGISEPDGTDETTEFLVAPLQTRGGQRSGTKAWVDRVRQERERREQKRLLYVAATRARDDLHLFARPEYQTIDGELRLANPSNNLLTAAWPALEDPIRRQFDSWKDTLSGDIVPDLAAEAPSNLIVMPSRQTATRIRRVPLSAVTFPDSNQVALRSSADDVISTRPLFERHEGGVASRIRGTAIHSLLQDLARFRASMEWPAARVALESSLPRVVAQIRAAGFERAVAIHIATEALESVMATSNSPVGQWLLAPHPGSASEAAWTGVIKNKVRTVRVDRVFRAAASPLHDGDDAWWVVDYKSAYDESQPPDVLLPDLRPVFAPQLEAYAGVLRALHGAGLPIFAGIYYPRMQQFDSWQVFSQS